MFDFVKDVGAKVLGKETGAEKEAREAAEKAEAATQARADARARAAAKQRIEEREQKAEATKSNELEKYVRQMGLRVEDLDITFDDGKATIKGNALGKGTKEKVILAVGNVEGVGQVDDRMTETEPEPPSRMYTVVSGDTLSKIAKEHYGDATKYPLIFEANKPMLTDPDLIYPGQVLRIPPVD